MSNIIQYFTNPEIQAVDLNVIHFSKSFNNQIVVFSNKTSVQVYSILVNTSYLCVLAALLNGIIRMALYTLPALCQGRLDSTNRFWDASEADHFVSCRHSPEREAHATITLNF